jgi:3-oxoacyl-(acyl-carrier-protein) synthase
VKPIVRLSGISANSNATDMVVPDPESSCSVMKMTIEDAGLDVSDITYINTHGTGTPTGDPLEMQSIKLLMGDSSGKVAINSTKSMTGHMIGATGAVEAIFCTMMMEKDFISPSVNLDNPEPEFAWADLVRECRNVKIRHSLSNSFGFGGTNASLVFSMPD